MAATGTAADAGLVADAMGKLNTSLGGKAKTTDLASKLDKPTGGSGQQAYNPATGAWEPVAASSAQSTLYLYWDHDQLRWEKADGSVVTSADAAALAAYSQVVADGTTALTADELGDVSWFPERTQILVSAGIV